MPEASQPPTLALLCWPPREEVFKDRFDCSIVIRSIVSDEVADTRL
jgi:hypothetical protein